MSEKKYDKYMIKMPVLIGHPEHRDNPARSYINNELVPGCNIYIEYAWVSKMREFDRAF